MNEKPSARGSFIHQWMKYSLLLLGIIAATGCGTVSSNESSEQIPAEPTHSEMVTLRAGDVLKVYFPGSANLDTTQQIRRDGKIALPLAGEVQAAGKTPRDLQQDLIKIYAPQISSKEVIVALESSAFQAYVTGCVIRPGKISSDKPMTALEAIMEAGGFDYAKSDLRNVRVIRRENNSSRTYPLNLQRVLNGKENKPFFLQPDDIVYVPEKFSWF